jgi:hypothetical protein
MTLPQAVSNSNQLPVTCRNTPYAMTAEQKKCLQQEATVCNLHYVIMKCTHNGEVIFVIYTAALWSNTQYFCLPHWKTQTLYLACTIHAQNAVLSCKLRAVGLSSAVVWNVNCFWDIVFEVGGGGDDFDQIEKIWHFISTNRMYIYCRNF